jgi:acetylornithine deacetylase
MNLSASSIPVTHGLVQAGIALKNNLWFPYPFRPIGFELQILEMGPGDTLRSHSADELYIFERNRRRNPTVYQNTWNFSKQ